ELALLGDEENAHVRDGGYRADRRGDGLRADLPVDPAPVDADVLVVRIGRHGDARTGSKVGDGGRVFWVNAVPQDDPGHRPVHGAGVEVPEAQPTGQPASDGRLAGARRSI